MILAFHFTLTTEIQQSKLTVHDIIAARYRCPYICSWYLEVHAQIARVVYENDPGDFINVSLMLRDKPPHKKNILFVKLNIHV
jgi:hypothetical protein